MSNGCDRYEALLLRLPDSDLTDAEADALRDHLRSCPSCRRLFRALEAASAVLEDELAEPPAELTENVMDRVLAAELASSVRSDSTRRSKASSKRHWRNLAVAACLVVVIGGAAFFARGFLGRLGAAAPAAESISMDSGTVPADMPAEAPMPEPEAAADGAVLMVEEAAAEAPKAAPEEAAEADADMPAGNGEAADSAAALVWPESSWMAPAQVPEGMEAAFEEIITDSHRDASMTTAAWDVIAYVEYKGIIYEFLTDDGGQDLLWRDAAEGLFPCFSPLTTDALHDIIG